MHQSGVRFWVIILLLAIQFGLAENSYAHDLKMTYWHFSIDQGSLILEAAFDKEDILNVLEKENGTACGSLLAPCLESYLKTHFSLSVNGKVSELNLIKLTNEPEIIRIRFRVESGDKQIRKITIENSFMIDWNPDYRNIVSFALEEDVRSFQMDKDRTTIYPTFSTVFLNP